MDSTTDNKTVNEGSHVPILFQDSGQGNHKEIFSEKMMEGHLSVVEGSTRPKPVVSSPVGKYQEEMCKQEGWIKSLRLMPNFVLNVDPTHHCDVTKWPLFLASTT